MKHVTGFRNVARPSGSPATSVTKSGVSSQRTGESSASTRTTEARRNPQRSVSPRTARVHCDIEKAMKSRYSKDRTIFPRAVQTGGLAEKVIIPANATEVTNDIKKADLPVTQTLYTQWRSATVHPFQKTVGSVSSAPVLSRESIGGVCSNAINTTPRELDVGMADSEYYTRDIMMSPAARPSESLGIPIRLNSETTPIVDMQARFLAGVSPDPRLHSVGTSPNPSVGVAATRRTYGVQPLNLIRLGTGKDAKISARYSQPGVSSRPIVHSYRRSSLKSSHGVPVKPISFLDSSRLSNHLTLGNATAVNKNKGICLQPTGKSLPRKSHRSTSTPFTPNPYINWTPLFTTNRPGHRFYLRSPSEGYPTNATTALPSSRSVSVCC